APARSAERITPAGAEERLAHRTERREHQVERRQGEAREHGRRVLRPGGAQRVPATTLSAAVLPHRRRRPTRLAPKRPVERVAEQEGAAIFLERLSGLAATLEDRAEERVDHRRAGRAHLDLLELVRGLVEHLQLELGAAELVVDGGQLLGLGRAPGRADGAEDPLLGVQRLAPAPALHGEVAETAQRHEMIATRLEDEPEGGGGLVAAAQAPRFLG